MQLYFGKIYAVIKPSGIDLPKYNTFFRFLFSVLYVVYTGDNTSTRYHLYPLSPGDRKFTQRFLHVIFLKASISLTTMLTTKTCKTFIDL